MSIDVVKYLKDKNIEVVDFPIEAKNLKKLVDLEAAKEVDHSTAKKIFIEALASKKSLDDIISSFATSDINEGELESFIDSILKDNHEEYDRLMNGETKLFNFFIGAVMKGSKGKFKPSDIQKYLKQKFNV